jgi:hypothetical protein
MGRNGLWIMVVVLILSAGGYAMFRNGSPKGDGPANVVAPVTEPAAATTGAPPAETPEAPAPAQ